MKQHITLEQLYELNDKGKDSYSEYLRKTDNHPWNWRMGEDPLFYLLSIGQMIEFLDDNEKDTCHDWRKDIFICEHYPHDTVSEINWSYDELCDALWEAVKEVLND